MKHLFIFTLMALIYVNPVNGQPGVIARGTVFLDQNQNGNLDQGERGISNVAVTNGLDVVLTNTNGNYQLSVTTDTIIAVIKPTGYMTPLNRDHLPQFYYIHKPDGSPKDLKYSGLAPTGDLPDRIDFPLYAQSEPETFKLLLFGDTQPYNMQQIEWVAHDVVGEVIGTEAVLGLSLGDLVGDNLSLFQPLTEVLSQINIPWYNVLGNHDQNYDAKDDTYSDETFEQVFGPTSYAFNWGKVHFIVIDNVYHLMRGGQRSYKELIGEKQLRFIENDLKHVPKDYLIVASMHAPLTSTEDGKELISLLSNFPHTLSFSAHTHYQRDDFISLLDPVDTSALAEDPIRDEISDTSNQEEKVQEPAHHHHNHATVSGSWWSGEKDELGIPHTVMSDGAPNGYSIVTFAGSQYKIRFKVARRPADYQMNIYTPWEVNTDRLLETPVIVNVFAGNKRTRVEMRVGTDGPWTEMKWVERKDPYYEDLRAREEVETLQNQLYDRLHELMGKPKVQHDFTLEEAILSQHIWQAKLPTDIPVGTHTIHIKATDNYRQAHHGRRIIRVVELADSTEE